MATDRSAYIEGLRELANRLEAHPDAPIPHDGSGRYAAIYVFASSREEFAAAARCYGGRKRPDDDHGLILVDGVPGLSLKVLPPQDGVCERVQTGTKPVERELDSCPTCGGELVSLPHGVVICSEVGADHFRAEPVAVSQPRFRVLVDQPVYETRCPESILAPEQLADALADEAVS